MSNVKVKTPKIFSNNDIFIPGKRMVRRVIFNICINNYIQNEIQIMPKYIPSSKYQNYDDKYDKYDKSKNTNINSNIKN